MSTIAVADWRGSGRGARIIGRLVSDLGYTFVLALAAAWVCLGLAS